LLEFPAEIKFPVVPTIGLALPNTLPPDPMGKPHRKYGTAGPAIVKGHHNPLIFEQIVVENFFHSGRSFP
jgi:hypothetical protein